MKTTLYNLIRSIDIHTLTEDDKEELLSFFKVTKNPLIWNHLALIFSDLHYEKAVPSIIEKIQEKETFNSNGTLVYALGNFDVKDRFIFFIRIICEQAYEARLMAYEIVVKYAPLISADVRNEALDIVNKCSLQLEKDVVDKGPNSTLHFVKEVKDLLLETS